MQAASAFKGGLEEFEDANYVDAKTLGEEAAHLFGLRCHDDPHPPP